MSNIDAFKNTKKNGAKALIINNEELVTKINTGIDNLSDSGILNLIWFKNGPYQNYGTHSRNTPLGVRHDYAKD